MIAHPGDPSAPDVEGDRQDQPGVSCAVSPTNARTCWGWITVDRLVVAELAAWSPAVGIHVQDAITVRSACVQNRDSRKRPTGSDAHAVSSDSAGEMTCAEMR